MRIDEDLSKLLSRIALGDRVAFEALYRATSAYLFSVALRTLGNENRADEILQEAYVNIWHGAAGYDVTIASPMTWLINIVRNKAIDALRSGRAERDSTDAFGDEPFEGESAAIDGPERMFESSMIKARIADCMESLSATQRQALALAYYRGMVHTEIAVVLKVPLGTAKGWVRRGLDGLKSCLEGTGVTGP